MFRRLTLIIVAVFTVIALSAVLIFHEVDQLDYNGQTYTGNAGELTGNVLVGQTFVSQRDNLSAIGLKFATYSNRSNTEAIIFHLRSSTTSPSNIRTVSIQPTLLGDNQIYKINFPPISDSAQKTYFFFITSPTSHPDNAVTIDINNQDPYHQGSAYLTHGEVSSLASVQNLARSGKPTIDLSFATYYRVPLSIYLQKKVATAVHYFIATWDEKKSAYYIWAAVFMQSFLLIGFSLSVIAGFSRNNKMIKDKGIILILGILIALAITARLIYALELPATNDEGNYLYDARTLLQGQLAGGDGYVKAPVVIIWIAFWQFLFGHTLLAGRLSSIVIGALTVIPIYLIGRKLWGIQQGLTAATVWALLGVTTVFNTYTHTQPLALFFGISGIATLLLSFKRTVLPSDNKIITKTKINYNLLFLTGLLLGLGVVSRKSILALGLIPLFTILINKSSLQNKLKQLLFVGSSFLLVILITLAVIGNIYGRVGVMEATGFNSAEDGLTSVEESQIEQVRAYSLKGMTPFFRESLPLILLAVIGFGFTVQNVALSLHSKFNSSRRHNLLLIIIAAISWVPSWYIFKWSWHFYLEYEGSSMMILGSKNIWISMAIIIVLLAVLTAIKSNTVTSVKMTKKYLALGIPIFWIAGLIFFYLNWIKFHANYIGEFLPPLVLLAGVALPAVWKYLGSIQLNNIIKAPIQICLSLTFLAILFWSLFVSNYITYIYEHTGTFTLKALSEASEWAEQHIAPEDDIFTGASIIPYLSGHHTVFDIAHPRWYAYEFTRKDTTRLNTFLPPINQMIAAYRSANWFLLEKQTGFSFLMEYSEIESGLQTDWERVHGIENGSNTLTFYKRVN